jgi:hypothetical protein
MTKEQLKNLYLKIKDLGDDVCGVARVNSEQYQAIKADINRKTGRVILNGRVGVNCLYIGSIKVEKI